MPQNSQATSSLSISADGKESALLIRGGSTCTAGAGASSSAGPWASASCVDIVALDQQLFGEKGLESALALLSVLLIVIEVWVIHEGSVLSLRLFGLLAARLLRAGAIDAILGWCRGVCSPFGLVLVCVIFLHLLLLLFFLIDAQGSILQEERHALLAAENPELVAELTDKGTRSRCRPQGGGRTRRTEGQFLGGGRSPLPLLVELADSRRP
eukprot:scaffold1090_cov265-Pinguiococcus_pyrenoidosus.AAC.11